MANDIPPEKSLLLEDIAAALRTIPNMAAIALGGSHARGIHGPESDLDIGLYYREAAPFDIDDIRAIAARFAVAEPTVTEFYEWGPFVNGGAWIPNRVCKIDFLYRNLDQLEGVIRDAHAGKWEHSFDQQPPFGFRSITTLGEIHCCRLLYDPADILVSLKAEVAVFPPALKEHIVQSTLWAAEFSLTFADSFAHADDVPNTVACMTRIFHYLEHALFALNDTYFINDKRALVEIAGFSRAPENFGLRIGEILARPGFKALDLSVSLEKLRLLFAETVALTYGRYRPKFAVKPGWHVSMPA